MNGKLLSPFLANVFAEFMGVESIVFPGMLGA